MTGTASYNADEIPKLTPSTHGLIKIDPVWGLSHRDLHYTHEEFNNPQDLESWRSLGFTQERFTGNMYDMRFEEPDWIQKIQQILPMENFCWSVYQMRPGDVLPEHSDTYQRFCKLYSIKDVQTIRRYVVFLEDWQSGHYFEIDNVPITGWQAGTAVHWQGCTPHLAANLGRTMRYTLQLTGIMPGASHDDR